MRRADNEEVGLDGPALAREECGIWFQCDCDWSDGLLFIGEELLQLLLFKEHQRGVADGLALVLF